MNIGEYVTYTNKNMDVDITGVVIGKEGDQHLIEAQSGTLNRPFLSVQPFWKNASSHCLAEYFNPPQTASALITTKSNKCFWLGRSRNLKKAWANWTQSQEGDTDDDI